MVSLKTIFKFQFFMLMFIIVPQPPKKKKKKNKKENKEETNGNMTVDYNVDVTMKSEHDSILTEGNFKKMNIYLYDYYMYVINLNRANS